MPDYSKAKVYSIRSHQTDQIYIGSTTEPLSKRMTKHREDMKRWQKGKRGKTTSYDILQYPDAYIELIEHYPCLCREGLLKREGEIIRATENCVNKKIEGRTNKQYRQDNADKIKQQKKQWYNDNIDKIKQQKKAWYQDNADKIKQQRKQYKIDNAEKLKEQANQKHDCPCGGKYTHQNKSHHSKSKAHRAYEEFMALTEEQVREWLKKI